LCQSETYQGLARLGTWKPLICLHENNFFALNDLILWLSPVKIRAGRAVNMFVAWQHMQSLAGTGQRRSAC